MTISVALPEGVPRSIHISRFHVDACVVEDLSLIKCLIHDHGFIEVDMQKLSHDFVAFPCVIQAHASAAISPEWLISRERVVDGLVNFILLTHMISCMRNTNCLRHVFLQDEFDLTATIAIVDQATIESFKTVFSAQFHTDVADKELY
jgi:hypothetical protein